MKDKSNGKKIAIIAIACVLLVVTALLLVLFIPYQAVEYCNRCDYMGKMECPDKRAEEYLSGQKAYWHDCNQCENGYMNCIYCGGDGREIVKTNNFKKLKKAF